MASIRIDDKKCEGSKCSLCAYACPTNVFSIENGDISIKSPDSCKLCDRCMEVCPKAAISIERVEIKLFQGLVSKRNRYVTL
jgi:NAD-dependent dihydropyrimidine dehydrogenase PreA subunit